MESFGFVPLFGKIQYWLLQIIEEPEAPPYEMESFGFVPFCTAKCIAANFISIFSFAIMFLSKGRGQLKKKRFLSGIARIT